MPQIGTLNPPLDGNQNVGIFGLSGTLGPTYGTAVQRPITVDDQGQLRIAGNITASSDPSTGTLNTLGTVGTVNGIGGVVQVSGTVTTGGAGTQPVRIIDGTVTNIGSINTIGTMPAVSLAMNSGTITTIQAGTQNTLGTVGSVIGIGTITNIGTIGTIAGMSSGSMQNIVTGTLNAGTVSLTDGTIGANFLAGAGTSSGQNAIFTAGAYLQETWSVTTPSNTTAKDVSNYKWVSVHIVTQYSSSTVTLQGSNDNSNWSNIYSYRLDNQIVGTGETSSNVIRVAPLQFRYFRVNIAGTYSSGTCAGVIEYYTQAPAWFRDNTVSATQSGSWNIAAGTQNTLGTVGTVIGVGSITNIGTIGTIAGMVASGTYVNIVTGTQQTLGTVGTIPGIGTITNIGSISNIGTMPASTLALNSGTITTIQAGTQNTLGTVGTVPGMGTVTNIGSITNIGSLAHIGTVGVAFVSGNLGSITNLGSLTNVGTLKGVDLVTRIGNIGTIESGTVTTTLALNTGTITTIAAGTQNTLGTVGTVPGIGTLTNLGSVTNIGTLKGIDLVTRIGNIGTIESGTVTTTLALNSGTITAGTIGGKAASGAAAIQNPVLIAGTDAGGTVYAPLVDTTGALKVTGASAGTYVNITTGTQQTLGTVGTVPGIGTITNIGTIGSIVGMPASTLTMNSGTITTIQAGTQNTLGTVGVLNAGTITSITNIVNGTIHEDFTPANIGTSLVTLGTTGVAVWGTLVAASGAGTKQYVSGVDVIVKSGTVDVAVTNIGIGGSVGAGVLVRGQFPAGGGIAKSFLPVQVSGTNGTLAYWLGGAGTVSINVQYWQGI